MAPAEAAAREREGREQPKRDGEGSLGEEVEEMEKEPRGREGKNCLGKRRETVRGAIGEARELWPKGNEKMVG